MTHNNLNNHFFVIPPNTLHTSAPQTSHIHLQIPSIVYAPCYTQNIRIYKFMQVRWATGETYIKWEVRKSALFYIYIMFACKCKTNTISHPFSPTTPTEYLWVFPNFSRYTVSCCTAQWTSWIIFTTTSCSSVYVYRSAYNTHTYL